MALSLHDELAAIESKLDDDLQEVQQLQSKEETSVNEEVIAMPSLSLMQEELRRANEAILAKVVASHMASEARRKAAFDRVLAFQSKQKTRQRKENTTSGEISSNTADALLEFTHEHKRAAARRDAALRRVIDFQRTRASPHQCEIFDSVIDLSSDLDQVSSFDETDEDLQTKAQIFAQVESPQKEDIRDITAAKKTSPRISIQTSGSEVRNAPKCEDSTQKQESDDSREDFQLRNDKKHEFGGDIGADDDSLQSETNNSIALENLILIEGRQDKGNDDRIETFANATNLQHHDTSDETSIENTIALQQLRHEVPSDTEVEINAFVTNNFEDEISIDTDASGKDHSEAKWHSSIEVEEEDFAASETGVCSKTKSVVPFYDEESSESAETQFASQRSTAKRQHTAQHHSKAKHISVDKEPENELRRGLALKGRYEPPKVLSQQSRVIPLLAPQPDTSWEELGGDRLRIERRGTRRLPYVLKSGDILHWQFRLRELNIGFYVCRRSMSAGGATENAVIPTQRYDSKRCYSGQYRAEEEGAIVLVFDNSDALFRSKEIACSVRLERSCLVPDSSSVIHSKHLKQDEKPPSSTWQSKYRREWTELHDVCDAGVRRRR